MPSGKPEPAAPDAAAAEAAAAEAEARAEAARARANELRRKLEASSADDVDVDVDETTEAPADDVDELTPAKKRRLRLPGLKAVAAALVVLVIAGLLSVTGWMLFEHRKATDERHRTAEYAAAARQGVVNLMSMDYTQAKESVQRVIDDSLASSRATSRTTRTT